MIRAVFFDVGNTLIYPYPSVGEIYRSIASDYGMVLGDESDVSAAFKAAFVKGSAMPLDDVDSERAWWRGVVWEAVSSLCRPQNFDSYFDALYQFFMGTEAWRIYEDVLPTLNSLKARGITLGVISNWDSRLPPLLDNLDLTRFFSVIAVSALVGSAKPDPHIFEYALGKSSIAPGEAIHIGDSPELDFMGAKKCGMHPFLIEREKDTQIPPEYTTLHSLDSIFDFL